MDPFTNDMTQIFSLRVTGFRRCWFRRWFVRGVVHGCARPTSMKNRNLNNLRRIIWPVVSIAGHVRDLVHHLNAGIVAWSEDGVAAIQMWVRNLGDKKLRAVSVRASVGVSQSPRTVKQQIRRGLILELVSGITGAGAQRISALDHELRNNAMKNSAVIKRNTVHLAAGRGVGPILGATRESDKIGYPNRGFVWIEDARQLAGCRIDNRGRRSCCGRRCRFLWHRLRRRLGRLRYELEGRKNNQKRKQFAHCCSWHEACVKNRNSIVRQEGFDHRG